MNKISSKLEEIFALQIRALKLPEPIREYQFFSHRRFRFDFAWIEQKVVVEIDGGIWTKGRHTRGTGYERDCVKNALAVLNGWKLYRFTGDMVKSGAAYNFIEQEFSN